MSRVRIAPGAPPTNMKLPDILNEIGAQADKNNIRAFVVGGFVRDLLLQLKDLDIDIVIEADAVKFAGTLGKEWGVDLIIHKGFKTAAIKKDGFKIDLVTARKEYYKRPGSLPEIKPATIKEDLFRRDFTINAMAISLNKDNFGELVDFYNGMHDLKVKNIRVLHNKSFIDDPTRIFRAIRFQERLGFKIEPYTQRLIKDAIILKVIEKLKPQRIKKEMDLILEEPKRDKIISSMHEFGIGRFVKI